MPTATRRGIVDVEIRSRSAEASAERLSGQIRGLTSTFNTWKFAIAGAVGALGGFSILQGTIATFSTFERQVARAQLLQWVYSVMMLIQSEIKFLNWVLLQNLQLDKLQKVSNSWLKLV